MTDDDKKLCKMCMAASFDDRLADGMLYRKAAEAIERLSLALKNAEDNKRYGWDTAKASDKAYQEEYAKRKALETHDECRRPADLDLRDYQRTISYLEGEVSKRENVIRTLENRIDYLNDEVERLSLDLRLVRDDET